MAVRPIDSEKYMELLKEQYLHNQSMGNSQAARAWQGAIQLLYDMPTLTPPNEWVSVEERLPPLRKNVLVCAYWHEHWGVYMGWNSGHGWTVSCGIGQRSDVQVSHWMPLPAPPDRRPPEGGL